MMKVYAVFCFKVMQDGEELFAKTAMKNNEGNVNQIELNDYDELHAEMGKALASQVDMDESCIIPISCNEYLGNTE